MADPISIFGAAAGTIQLADVALRAAREAYDFLGATRDAGKDIDTLRQTLREVESNVRTLRNFICSFSQSRTATAEFEVLPATITNSLTSFHSDIEFLKTLLPPTPSPSLARKIKWAFDKRKVRDLTTRLAARKADLAIALSLVGRLHDLHHRRDAADLSAAVKEARDAVIQEQRLLQSAIATQALAMSQHVQNVNDEFRAARSASLRHREHVESALSTQATTLQYLASTAGHSPTAMLEGLRTPSIIDNGRRTEAVHELTRTRRLMEAANDGLVAIESNSTFSASTVDLLAQVFRSELRSSLAPIVEQSLGPYKTANEAHIRRMETAIDRMSFEIGTVTSGISETTFHNTNIRNDGFSSQISQQGGDWTEPRRLVFQAQRTTTATIREKSWSIEWKMGTISIIIRTVRYRRVAQVRSEYATSIHIDFRPGAAWNFLPGISTFYSTAPDSRGFNQLAPMISVFPVIADEHPIWGAIQAGDLEQVQRILSGGLSIRSQDTDGMTLLDSSVLNGRVETTKLLLSCGLTWEQINGFGKRPFAYAAVGPIFLPLLPALRPSGPIPDHAGVMQLAMDSGHDAYELWCELVSENLSAKKVVHIQFSKEIMGPYLKATNLFFNDLGISPWEMYFAVWAKTWCLATESNLNNLKTAVGIGLDPNLQAFNSRPLLHQAIYGIRREKLSNDGEDGNRDSTSGDEEGTGEEIGDSNAPTRKEKAKLPPWCLVKVLIDAGADLHRIDPNDFDNSVKWYSLRTPWTWAHHRGVTEEYWDAVGACGLNPQDVATEDVKRRKEAFRLQGAKRTGMDEEMLALPSRAGLRCRICSRKFCNQMHGTWALGV